MKARILPAALTALAALCAAPAAARAAALANAPTAPTVSLPGDVTASAADADPATWIVGVRPGGAALARAHGARRLGFGAWLSPRGRATALARALSTRGLLDYAEPNRISHQVQAPAPDPLSPSARWRDFVVMGAVPPPVSAASPLIGMVDTEIDVNHPEIRGSNITTKGGAALNDLHGTATATVAAAPSNGVGMLGIWPGARVLNVPLADGERITCGDSVRGIAGAVAAHAAVINMSYGSRNPCEAELRAILRAVKKGAVPVAASGNEFSSGNPLEFPASLPHVITVAAVGPDDKATGFSSDSAAVDLSAPGIGILTGVPVRFDTDDDAADGFALVAGTSFSAPMVSAAVAWVRAARPALSGYQAGQVVRLGARDVGRPGYENSTGFGVLSMPGALGHSAPADDPLEPNDDLRYVNGRALGDAAPPLSHGLAPASITATVDLAEDPTDVYRVKVRAHDRMRLKLNPSVGDPDLFVFGPRAHSINDGSNRVSARSGEAIDRLTIRNHAGRTRTFYAAVGFRSGKSHPLLNATYKLSTR